MAKYKMCSGLAMAPDRDLQMLKSMSKQGWHLVGMKGVFYQFEKGNPSDYDYALNLEPKTDENMLSFYEASGWSPVILESGYQIYRAKTGTAPIFSDNDSEEEVLLMNQKAVGRWASIFGIFLVMWFIVTGLAKINIAVTAIGMVVLITCFIFTFFPYIGFGRSLRKLRK